MFEFLYLRRVELTDLLATKQELKSYRQAKNLTQAQMAALIHVPTRTFERWEQGRSQIPAGYWELLHYKLDIWGQYVQGVAGKLQKTMQKPATR